MIFKKIISAIFSPKKIVKYIITKYPLPFLSDEKFLKIKYRLWSEKKLNLDSPQTFNEKLQWLKLHDRKPEYTVFADKYKVRDYVAEKIGDEYLVPLLGVWDNENDIDFDSLPKEFVMKCNHASGIGMYICHDKSTADFKQIKKVMRKGLKTDYYMTCREWPYKNIERKIIAEQYLENVENNLDDYKFMTFGGKVKCIYVCRNRFTDGDVTKTFYDTDWKPMPFYRKNTARDDNVPKPDNLDAMIALAEKLAVGTSFIRVDFYDVNSKIYFGELTLYHTSGFIPFSSEDGDILLGSWLDITTE